MKVCCDPAEILVFLDKNRHSDGIFPLNHAPIVGCKCLFRFPRLVIESLVGHTVRGEGELLFIKVENTARVVVIRILYFLVWAWFMHMFPPRTN